MTEPHTTSRALGILGYWELQMDKESNTRRPDARLKVQYISDDSDTEQTLYVELVSISTSYSGQFRFTINPSSRRNLYTITHYPNKAYATITSNSRRSYGSLGTVSDIKYIETPAERAAADDDEGVEA